MNNLSAVEKLAIGVIAIIASIWALAQVPWSLGMVTSPYVSMVLLVLIAVVSLLEYLLYRYAKTNKIPFWGSKIEMIGDKEETQRELKSFYVLGLLQIAFVPPGFEWVLQNSLGSPEIIKEGDAYTVTHVVGKKSGWRCAFLPGLMMITMEMVDVRSSNINPGQVTVNTSTTPVHVDTQVQVKRGNAPLSVVALRQKMVDVTKQVLTPALNHATEGYSSEDLTHYEASREAKEGLKSSAEILEKLQTKTRQYMNDELLPFGIQIESVRVENIHPLEEILASQAERAAALQDRAAVDHLSHFVEEMAKAAGGSDKAGLLSLGGLLLHRLLAPGRRGTGFPAVSLQVGGQQQSGGDGDKSKSSK